MDTSAAAGGPGVPVGGDAPPDSNLSSASAASLLLSLDGMRGGDHLHVACGEDATPLQPHFSLLGLPRAAAPPDKATALATLPSPLKTLAKMLRPSRLLIDLGGEGQCGPNTLSYLFGLVALSEEDGPELRADVAAHAAKPEVLASTTSVFVEGGRPLAMQELIELNVSHWPEHAMHGLERTVESWRQLIVRPDCWTDVAFTQLAADLRRAHIHLIAVDDLSKVWDMGTISPCNGVQGTALVEVGVWYNRHFVAVVDALPAAGAEPLELHAPQPSSGAAAEPGFTFPITTLDEVRRLLRSRNPPTDLCGFEFSGAQRSALEAKGRVALSADERDCVIGGMHFKGDVRPLLTITVWQRAYLFPPCFQQLRGDLDCIELKIEDGRAFWGSAMVLLCIFLTTALMLLVE